MDFGNKNVNNLISKDYKVSIEAAGLIINSKDIEAYRVLCEKSEFIFDFIKDKILKNLTAQVNETNVLNLFEFTKIYSSDFKDFILSSFVKFNSDKIEEKMSELLNNGSDSEKAHAVEFFTLIKKPLEINKIRKLKDIEFNPLKEASVKYLKKFNEREDYNLALKTLSYGSDNYEKLKSVEFLALYGDKEAFAPVFDYFIQSGFSYMVSSALILIKPFEELIENGLEYETFMIFSSFLMNFPEDITFNEVSQYLNSGVLNGLIETEDNFGALILVYLKYKIDLILSDGAYSIDLDKKEKAEAQNLKENLDVLISAFDKTEILKTAILSSNKIQILIALEIMKEEKINFASEIKNLILETNDFEIIFPALRIIFGANGADPSLINKILAKTNNDIIKNEIETFL